MAQSSLPPWFPECIYKQCLKQKGPSLGQQEVITTNILQQRLFYWHCQGELVAINSHLLWEGWFHSMVGGFPQYGREGPHSAAGRVPTVWWGGSPQCGREGPHSAAGRVPTVRRGGSPQYGSTDWRWLSANRSL